MQDCSQWLWATGAGGGAGSLRAREGSPVPSGEEHPVSERFPVRSPLSCMFGAHFCHGHWQTKEWGTSTGQKRVQGDYSGDFKKEKGDLVQHLFPISSFPLPSLFFSLHTPPAEAASLPVSLSVTLTMLMTLNILICLNHQSYLILSLQIV